MASLKGCTNAYAVKTTTIISVTSKLRNSTPLPQKTSGDNQLLRFNCGAIELHHPGNQGNALGLEFVANAVCLGKIAGLRAACRS